MITLRFTSGEMEIWSNISKSWNIMTMIVSKFFFFMSLLTASIVKNSHVLAEINFIFLKNAIDQT